jgi:hypothetical protein
LSPYEQTERRLGYIADKLTNQYYGHWLSLE